MNERNGAPEPPAYPRNTGGNLLRNRCDASIITRHCISAEFISGDDGFRRGCVFRDAGILEQMLAQMLAQMFHHCAAACVTLSNAMRMDVR